MKNEKESRSCFMIFRKERLPHWIVIIVLVIGALAVFTAGLMCYRTYTMNLRHEEINREWLRNTGRVYFQALSHDSLIVSADSLKISSGMMELPAENLLNKKSADKNESSDTVKRSVSDVKDKVYYILTKNDLQNIVNGQKLVVERQDALAQDLRQESNNLINKMNGWLAFWLGIMALLGVFIPLAMQFKLSHDSKEEQKLRIKEFNQKKEELQRTERELKKKVDNNLDMFRADIKAMEYTALVRNFQYVFETPEINVNEYRRALLLRIWDKMIIKLHLFISDYCNSADDKCRMESIHELTVVLMMTTNVLSLIARLSPRRIRHVRNIIDETSNIIKCLNEPSQRSGSLCERLDHYYDTLRTLNINC